MTPFYTSKTQKNSIPKLLDTKISFSHAAGYKINLQESVAFLYTNKEKTKKEYIHGNATREFPVKLS
jgi:hypothetical protein